MRVIPVLTLSLVVGCGSAEPITDAAPPQAAGLPTRTAPADSRMRDFLQSHDLDGVSVELVGVEVGTGDTVQVRWRFFNHTAEERVLAGGVDRTDAEFLLTADAFLVDDTHQKKYLVVVDENDVPVASRHGGPDWVVIGPGEQIDAWAKFPAPAPETTIVSVHVPGAPPFEDVEIPVRQGEG